MRSTPTSTDRRRLARWVPIVAGIVLSVLLVAAVALMPTRSEATAVIGLRSVAEAEVRPVPDELQIIAEQYAVVLSRDSVIDSGADSLSLAGDPDATITVDPESATLRIVATADDDAGAIDLANYLARAAEERTQDDYQVDAQVLGEADPTTVEATPSKVLYLGAGLGAIWLVVLAVWLLRRPRT